MEVQVIKMSEVFYEEALAGTWCLVVCGWCWVRGYDQSVRCLESD